MLDLLGKLFVYIQCCNRVSFLDPLLNKITDYYIDRLWRDYERKKINWTVSAGQSSQTK